MGVRRVWFFYLGGWFGLEESGNVADRYREEKVGGNYKVYFIGLLGSLVKVLCEGV